MHNLYGKHKKLLKYINAIANILVFLKWTKSIFNLYDNDNSMLLKHEKD